MVIFHSYVKLPEGNTIDIRCYWIYIYYIVYESDWENVEICGLNDILNFNNQIYLCEIDTLLITFSSELSPQKDECGTANAINLLFGLWLQSTHGDFGGLFLASASVLNLQEGLNHCTVFAGHFFQIWQHLRCDLLYPLTYTHIYIYTYPKKNKYIH